MHRKSGWMNGTGLKGICLNNATQKGDLIRVIQALSKLVGGARPFATFGGGNRGSCLTHANWGF